MVLGRTVSSRGLAIVSLYVAAAALAGACATPYGDDAELPSAADSGSDDAARDGADANASPDADAGVDAAAPDGAALPPATCTSDGGAGCRCPPMATCTITCAAGPCDVTCTNATCDVTCNDDCVVHCESSSKCTVKNGSCSASGASTCMGS